MKLYRPGCAPRYATEDKIVLSRCNSARVTYVAVPSIKHIYISNAVIDCGNQ